MRLEKAHRLAAFAIAAWGFIALLVTGDFSPVLIGLCCGLVVAAYLAPAHPSSLRIILWNVLTAFVFVGVILIARQSLLDATVYFFMYLQIAKLFTMRKSNDVLWVYVISFFHVIGTAVLTTSLAFAAVFLVYVVLMALSMTLFTVHREFAGCQWDAGPVGCAQGGVAAYKRGAGRNGPMAHDGQGAPFPTRGFLLGSGFLSLSIVATSIAFFMVIPRLSTQSLFRTDFGQPMVSESTSAFSETVDFGAFQKIHLDSSVALYVEPMDRDPAGHVRLRGVSLDSFDGQRWRRSMSQQMGQPFARFTRRQVQLTRRRFRIIQPPGITNFIFAPTFPDDLQVELLAHVVFDAVSNAAWLPRVPTREISYTVISKVENLEDRRDPQILYPSGQLPTGPGSAVGGGGKSEPDSAATTQQEGARALNNLVATGRELVRSSQRQLLGTASRGQRSVSTTQSQRVRRSGRGYGRTSGRAWHRDLYRLPEPILERYLQIPERMDSGRVSQLAAEWARDFATPYEKARAVERHLRTDYGYSLETRLVPGGDFVGHFLFESREGHCEYFATSMVMMLRTLGIPSRIVNGFYSTEWSNLSRVFTVRQKDAHSWVEVYFDNYGWMTFDPTPPGGLGRTLTSNALVRGLQSLLDAARVRWYRHMIDYDYTSQIGIVRGVIRLAHKVGKVVERLQLSSSRGIASSFGQAGRKVGTVAVALALVALCVALVYAGLSFRVGTGGRRACPGKRKPFSGPYAELLRRLKRLGYVRITSETPREFALRVARAPGLEPVRPITESYYAERFASKPLSQDDLRVLAAFLKHLKTR